MPIAISPDESWEYQLVCDRVPNGNGQRDEACKADSSGTFFSLRPLTPRAEASIEDSCITLGPGAGGKLVVSGARLGERSVEILSRCLTGWRQFKDASGAEVKFEKDMDTNLARLAPEHRHELAAAVSGRTRVSLSDSD